MYQHKIVNNASAVLPIGKIVCIGRNYAAHAQELNNPIPSTPILFMKPSTAMVSFEQPFSIPTHQGSVHHEVEIAILIGETLTNTSVKKAKESIYGIGLALDLTLRDVQNKLKENGHPWEIAKSFDGSCPITPFVKISEIKNLTNIPLTLHNNGKLKQQGNSADMLTPIIDLLVHISQTFTLHPGDVVLTGTPAGVGPLHSGDQLVVSIPDVCEFKGTVK